MIIIHEKTAQKFDTLGLGALLPSSCVVTEEINGAYELKLSHPYDEGGKWKRIERGRILYASTPRGMQPFRIYNTKPNMSGIEVNARHIFYDLLDNQCSEISFNGTASGALAALQGAFSFAMPFSFTTDVSVTGMLETGRMNPVQVLLSDDDETTSFVKGFGGELLRDGFNVSLLAAMGQDRDVVILYGKNLAGLEVTEDEADVKTRIQYYGSDGSGTLDSTFIHEYVYPKIHTLEDENKTKAELKAEAQSLFDGGIDIPLVNIKVDFIVLADTVEYADYAPLEEVFLGDTVTIINQRMNFVKKARVISYEWDCLLEKYNEVELGDFMPTLASSVTSGVRSGSLASAAAVGASAVAAALQAHLQDKNNPHEVTSEQTGGSSSGSGNKQQILYGEVIPESSKGNDGDVYILTEKSSEGIDEDTLFLLSDLLADTSGNNVSIANNGVSVSETQSKFGGKALYLDGNSYLEVNLAVEGDVTIDCWMYFSEYGSSYPTPFQLASSSSRGLYMHAMSSATKLGASSSSDDLNDLQINEILALDTWNHIAIVRSGSNVSMYVNGEKKGTLSNSLITNDKLILGHLSSAESGTKFKGYLDEFRISKVARWIEDFTPPAKAYSSAEVGSLWLKQNGTWTQVLKGAA